MASPQRHIQLVPPTIRDVASWVRQCATTLNGLIRGGPHMAVWRDQSLPLGAGHENVGSGPTWGTVRDGLTAYAFSASTTNDLEMTFVLDHNYQRGTLIYPSIRWTANSTNTGTVRWGIEYSAAIGHAQAAFPASTTVYIEQAFTGTAYTHMVAEVAAGDAIDGDALNLEPDALIMMRILRDGGHANDTFTADAFGLSVSLHYQADRFGTQNKAPDFYGEQ